MSNEFKLGLAEERIAQLEVIVATQSKDIEAYRGALGYSIPGTHDGKLSNGETPQCGICNSDYTKTAKEHYEKWLNDSSLETWFPISAERLHFLERMFYTKLEPSLKSKTLCEVFAEEEKKA